MPRFFKRIAESRRIRSEMRGYGADLLDLRTEFEDDLLARADDLGWHEEAPGLVVALGASAGAAVALGTYGVRIRATFKESAEPISPGPPDPIWALANALDYQQPITDAFRVLMWAYVNDVVTQLWPEQYAGVCGEIATVAQVANDHEAEVFRIGGPLDADLSDDDLAEAIVFYRRGILAAVAAAAIGEPVTQDNLWLGMAFPPWNDCYVEGSDVVAERMAQLAPHGLPGPS